MRRLAGAAVLGLMLAGCQGFIPRGGGVVAGTAPLPLQSISYETGPCFGSCPVYSFTVASDGRGSFTGKNFTAVGGTRTFEVTRAQFAAFAAALAPYRPNGEVRIAPGSERCGQAATDLPSTQVRWTGRDRRAGDHLYLYHGCTGAGNAATAQALGNAPDLIPALEPLIGARP